MATLALKVKGFTRMNTSVFYGSKVDEDSQDVIHEVYKIITIMGLPSKQKTELAT